MKMTTRLINELKNNWIRSNINLESPATDQELISFQAKNNVSFPDDLIKYFSELNGSSVQYDDKLFKFYSLLQFVSIENELASWAGIPDYTNIVRSMEFHENCFVFSDYFFRSSAYAIRLYEKKSNVNEIYVIIGDEYRLIANSLSEFVDLYLKDASELYLTD